MPKVQPSLHRHGNFCKSESIFKPLLLKGNRNGDCKFENGRNQSIVSKVVAERVVFSWDWIVKLFCVHLRNYITGSSQ